MMAAADVVTVVVGAGGVLVAILAYFKYKPGQREAVDLTIAQANMNVAQGTFQMVTTELEDQFRRMAAEVKDLRDQLAEERRDQAQYREDVDQRLAELGAELRSAKAEKATLQRENRRLKSQVAENDQLKQRITDLEAEVRSLKARQS